MGRRKNNIKYLITLLGRMSRPERNSLIQHFGPEEGKGPDQCVELLQLLLDPEQICEPNCPEAATANIYSQFSPAKVSNLSSRIILRIYETLLLDENIKRKGAHSAYSKTYLQVNKKILQAQVLWGRGVLDKVPALIDQLEKQCRKFELYKELIRVLEMKQEFHGLRKGPEFFHQISREIEEVRKYEVGLRNARRYYYLVMLENEKPEQQQVSPEEVEMMLAEIRSLRQEMDSRRLEYYETLLEVDLLEKSGNYPEAITSCLDLWKQVEDFEALNSEKRMGTTFLQLAHLHLMEGHLPEVIKFVDLAKAHFPPRSFNQFIADEQHFLALFYQRHWEAAAAVLSPLLDPQREFNESFRIRLNSYQAALLYRQGDPGAALAWLQEHCLVRNLRGEWNIANRIFEVILLIEKQRLDQVEYALDTLRKHLARFAKKEAAAAKRWQQIFSILKNLNKHSFCFDRCCQDSHLYLESVTDHSRDSGWRPRSAELIPFQEWFLMRHQAEKEGEGLPTTLSAPANELKFNFFDR